ncbi:hypothetical protein ZIOFF_037681 [Zingiber officinale]|uniref:[RNA-polymerase]-subunit kinase n=1 Tax=Zingiber officinale TaxID=94328 RepID=A0A8J5GDJ0_ZINOF|nr:hypothetical protein ZIOFF_037681 [Zingiber officinale]
MGCVQAKEASTPPSPASLSRRRSRRREKERPAATAPLASGRKSQTSLPRVETSIDAPDAVARQEEKEQVERPAGERQSRRRRSRPDPRLSNPSGHLHGEQVAAGWPPWLAHAAGESLQGWTPRRADSFEKIDKARANFLCEPLVPFFSFIFYCNVYKARDTLTGKIVALKKVRFDIMEPESVKFMAREILILRHLDHPNVVKLEGLVTSRLSCSLYLVFEYMEHDLAGLISSPTIKFTVPQVKCYMHQLLSGLEHCHNNGVLHRDIKGSNLLLDNEGLLKIADFGLATFFDPNRKHPMTSRVVTLWYRPPELLLGATDYAVGVDIWSAGCILAELLAGKPIMPGRTEVEQLHKIFKLCGSPSEDYWKKSKLPHATIFKPQQPYKCCIRESFKDFPQSALLLVETLLAIDPAERQTATAALNSEESLLVTDRDGSWFYYYCYYYYLGKRAILVDQEPYACDPSSLPKYPPSKEMDAKMRDEEARRLRAAGGKAQANGSQKIRTRDRAPRAVPAPEANAELQANIDVRQKPTVLLCGRKQENQIIGCYKCAGVGVIKQEGIAVGLICKPAKGMLALGFIGGQESFLREEGLIPLTSSGDGDGGTQGGCHFSGLCSRIVESNIRMKGKSSSVCWMMRIVGKRELVCDSEDGQDAEVMVRVELVGIWAPKKMRLLTHANAKSKSEKFPPPHQDGALGYQLDPSHNVDASFDNSDASFSTIFPYQKGPSTAWSGPLGDPAAGGLLKRKKHLATSVYNSVQSKQFDTVHSTRDDHKDKGRLLPWVSVRLHGAPGVSLRQHSAGGVPGRQHVAGAVSGRQHAVGQNAAGAISGRQHAAGAVSDRQHAANAVSDRQHATNVVSGSQQAVGAVLDRQHAPSSYVGY